MNIIKNGFWRLSRLLMVILLSCSAYYAQASHIYGADLYYTHVSGNTYTVSMVLYGDCSGAIFSSLSSSSPRVDVYNGSSYITTLSLSIQNPTAGVEVTPVCPSQINNTKCSSPSNTIPGIKKFVYSANITLSTTSANWRFRFNGTLSSSAGAGRSYSLTNIVNSSTNPSTMNLEATLNNTSAPNSSPTYTTIPTPFFCINKAGSYNPGTTDINGDNLTYNLVAGLESSGTVTYLTGYSATAPLAVSTGTFSFSTSTGQLNFTPNLVQQSLVVTRVSEYRSGVLVGTSMREMTFVVINNCSNNPPGGLITNNNIGTVYNSGSAIKSCKSSGLLTFNINATDADNDAINMVVNGLPAGATFNITNNNTTAPTGTFSWNLATATAGSYNFFITYTDAGCPLSSKQTVAYTVVVLPEPEVTVNITAPATCTKKAVFTMTPSITSPWDIQILQGSTVLHSFTGLTGAQVDSLAPGSYNIRIYNADTCFKDVPLVIDPPPVLGISLNVTPLVCHDDTNAVVVVKGLGGKPSFTYAKGSAAYGTIDTFKNISAGYYTFKVKDQNECVKDTVIQIVNPVPVSADVTLKEPPCNYYNSGVITIDGKNGTAPYTYAFNNNPYAGTNTFSGLFSGNYPVKVKDDLGCVLDTTVLLPDSVRVTATALLTDILCNGASTGAITLNAQGGTAPYKYRLNGKSTLGPINSFSNLPAGIYPFHIEDTNKCYLDSNVVLQEPVAILNTQSIVTPLCFSDVTGSITVSGIGGVPPYTYAIGTGTYSTSGTFNPLAAGTYTIHIKDNNNCIKDTNITVTQPAELSFSNIQTTNPTCYNKPDGQVILTGTGGVTPYEYAIGTGVYSTINTFSAVSSGNNIFHVKDKNGCTKDSVVTLTQPTRIMPVPVVTKSTCIPLNNGKVTMSASGGTPGYKYALGGGSFSTTTVFSSLASGTYLLRTKDQNDCIIDTTLEIKDSLTITNIPSITDARCFDSSSGIINISAGGGVMPYKYSVGGSPFSAVPAVGGLKAGNYTVKVVDDIGCGKDTLVTLNEPPRISSQLVITQPSCFTYSDGSIGVIATGGTPTYGYAINGGTYKSFATITGVAAGQHIVSIKDMNDCIFDTTVTINQPDGMTFALQVTNLKCFNDSSGIVIVKGKGGTKPYTYTFNNEPYSPDSLLENMHAGSNTIIMKDQSGCLIDTTITLTQPAQLLLNNPLITSPTCEGYPDGSIKIYGNGGVQPYVYGVNSRPVSTSNIFDSLQEGENIVRVVDANGCEYDTTIVLTGLPHIIFDEITPTDVSCFDGNDGRIDFVADGGVPPFAYSINNSKQQTTNSFTGLNTGSYTVTITDSAGCIKDSTIAIGSPEKMEITTKVTPNDCEGFDDQGMIDAYVAGGTPAYEYEWNTVPVQTGYNIKGMPNGTYTVKVKDANGCVDSASTSIFYDNCCIVFVPDAFTPNNDGLNDIIRVRVKGDFDLQTFSIYNRFGQRVFETSDQEKGWDGIFNGTPQDLGTFNYFVKGICGNAGRKEVFYKGTITLLR